MLAHNPFSPKIKSGRETHLNTLPRITGNEYHTRKSAVKASEVLRCLLYKEYVADFGRINGIKRAGRRPSSGPGELPCPSFSGEARQLCRPARFSILRTARPKRFFTAA
jgi:hypothetical protein